MAEDAQVPVFASVRAAFEFLKQNWSRFAPGAMLAAFGSFMFSVAVASGDFGLVVLAFLFAAATSILFRAALFRFAFTGDAAGPGGLRLSEDEGRLALVSLMAWLFMSLVLIVTFTPLMLVVLGVAYATGDPAALEAATGDSAATMAALSPQAETLLRVGGLAVFGFLVFVYVRLCLHEPATIAERRIVFLKSWPWTRGSFWRVLAGMILALLPGFGAGNLIAALGAELAAAGAGFAGMLFVLAGALVASWVGGMMNVGLLAFLYRGLRPAEPSPPA